MPGRLDHVTIRASDFVSAARFYDAALGALGLVRLHELGDEELDDVGTEVAGWGSGERAVLWLIGGAAPTTSVHVAFRADDRAQVERFHAEAVAAGGTSHDPPRRWTIFRTGEFNAIVRDPDGNLVEAVSPE